jgi:carbamoylphosphate synthase large subunit
VRDFLLLEDGSLFPGRSVAAPGIAYGEAVFTTAMSGYQEVATDPSYAGQLVCFTAPMVGNYGVAPERDESGGVAARGVLMRKAGGEEWCAWLAERGVVALEGIDTRSVVLALRSAGAMRGAVVAGSADPDAVLAEVRATPRMAGLALVADVSATGCTTVGGGDVHVGLIDYGTKRSIVSRLVAAGATVTVFPHATPADEVLGAGVDGVLLSNGPGDPAALPAEVAEVERLVGRTPILGICLGHQLLGRRSCPSVIGEPIIRCSTGQPAGCSSRFRTTASRSRGRARRSPTSRSTTAPSRGSRCRRSARARCSSIPRPGPARTTPGRSSSRSSRRCAPMPARRDLRSICVIGAGPIVIGQACEFDYAGSQALKVLRGEGYRTIVVNSNPATIMTDPGFADRTYIEPLDLEGVTRVLERERPDALLPTLGGQTALNLASRLATEAILDEFGVELIGASLDAIERAEDRERFRETVESIGLRVPTSRIVTSLDDLRDVSLPAVVRPAFTLGGHGGGFALSQSELRCQVEIGLRESPIGQVLVEESVRGWDEFELEVMRDRADNVVVVCSIENLDPMGVHTGDSVTVAPQLTLPDEAYQELRDAAAAIIRAVGVETGGSNVQFARDRETGEVCVIEMNPRVSRSSALASKATGYPIAKVAAKLAVGYTLDEIPNDLTGTTPASFEPTLDYVVVKFPRFAFEKFPGADRTLGTQMKSVGETMGIGRTFAEAFLKAYR